MGQSFWPIIGYGLEVKHELFDAEKLSAEDKEPWEIVIDRLTDLRDVNFIEWATTGDIYNEEATYIYLPASMPWDSDQNITREDVRKIIYKILSPWLSAQYTEEVLAKMMGDIHACGCG